MGQIMERSLKEEKVFIVPIWEEWEGFSLTVKPVAGFFGNK